MVTPEYVHTCDSLFLEMAEYEDPFEGSSFRLVHTLKNWDDAQVSGVNQLQKFSPFFSMAV